MKPLAMSSPPGATARARSSARRPITVEEIQKIQERKEERAEMSDEEKAELKAKLKAKHDEEKER